MSQENKGTNSSPMENAPVKRKRGRPRKDENLVHGEPASTSLPSTDMVRRNRRRRVDQTSDAMVGQVVSGVLEGSFDAGYLLTVRVGSTNTVLRGVVFEPGLSVPISVANDVAPHVKMFKRNEIPLPMVDLPTQVHGTNLQSEQNNERLGKVSGNEGFLPSKLSPPVKQVPRAPQLSLSQVQTNPMAFSEGEVNDANNVPKTAPYALQQEESKAKSSPSLPAKGLAGESSSDANHALQVSSQLAASQTENRMPTDVMQNDMSGLPTREPEGLPVDACQVVQVSMQTEAPQVEKRKSIDFLSNDKSDLPASEPGRVPIDINQVVHVPLQAAASQAEARKSTYGLPNDKFDLPASEREGPPNDASQVIEDSLQAAVYQSENRKATNVLPDDKTDLHTRELDSSNQATLIKPEQVVQPVLKDEPSMTQPLLLEHDTAVEPNEMLQGNEPAALIKQPPKNTNAPEDSESTPCTAPCFEKLPGCESIDQITQIKSHAMISELKPGWHADDALTHSEGSEVKLNCIPVSDPPQPVAAQPDNEVTNSVEKKASPEDCIPVSAPPQPVAAQADNEVTNLVKKKASPNDCIPVSDPPQPVAAQPDNEVTNLAEKKASSNDCIPVSDPPQPVTAQPDNEVTNLVEKKSSPNDCIPASDPAQPAAVQPDNEVTNLVEKKASPKDDTSEDSTSKLSDEIPSRAEFSHLDGRAIADDSAATKRHIESEPQTCQTVDMLHRGSSSAASFDMEVMHVTMVSVLPQELPQPQLNNPAMSMQNEDGVSKDASLQLQMLQRKTTPAAYGTGAEHVTAQSIHTKEVAEAQIPNSSLSMQNEDDVSKDVSEWQKGTTPAVSLDLGAEETMQSVLPKVPEHQISTSIMPIQNEDSILEDAFPSVQSQCDLVESKDADSVGA